MPKKRKKDKETVQDAIAEGKQRTLLDFSKKEKESNEG